MLLIFEFFTYDFLNYFSFFMIFSLLIHRLYKMDHQFRLMKSLDNLHHKIASMAIRSQGNG